MQRCRCELSTGLQIWFHVKPRECGLAHRGETGRSRTIRSQVASPSGSQTTLISSSSPTELFSHLGDVLHMSPRHGTIDHHGIRDLFHDRRPHAQFDTEPTVGLAVAVPPHSPSTVSGSVSRETMPLPASIGKAISVPCPNQMTERTATYCAGTSPTTTPVAFDATKTVFSSKLHNS